MGDERKNIIDEIISKLNIQNVDIINISLIADESEMKNRLQNDIDNGARSNASIEKSLLYLSCYDSLNTIKIDTSNIDIEEVAYQISRL